MEIVIGLLILMCIVVGCGAFIGIIVPIPRLGLKTRKRALGILRAVGRWPHRRRRICAGIRSKKHESAENFFEFRRAVRTRA